MVGARAILVGASAAALFLGGCSANRIAHTPAQSSAPIDSSATLGQWTIADPIVDPEAGFGEGVRVTGATLSVTSEGFDRITTIERGQRRIEVGETGSWIAQGATLALTPEVVTVIVTQPGDVSAETFEPESTGDAAARLSLVGDRLVLEMLEQGQPVGRIAYRRER